MPIFTFTRTREEVVTISADNLEDAQYKIEYSGQDFDWECVDMSDPACIDSSDDC